MGFVRLFGVLALSQAMLVGFLLYNPTLLDIDPKAYTIPVPPALEGPLEQNELLANTQRLFGGRIRGPESFAVSNGKIYTSSDNGFVVRIDNDQKFTKIVKFGSGKCEGPWEQHLCGRPLGMRATKDNRLYVVDPYYGLFSVDLETGKSSELLSAKTKVAGEHLGFLDHLDINEATGKIYMTQFSTKWDFTEVLYSLSEWDDSGRVLSYDVKTGKVEVLLQDLHGPNGIQISHDGNAILISETFMWRILRYEIAGPKKGEVSVFANLPGEADNIVSSSRGGYWLAIINAHNRSQPGLETALASYPSIRKLIARSIYTIGSVLDWVADLSPELGLKHIAFNIKSGHILMSSIVQRCMILETDSSGTPLRSFQSSDQRFCYFSEALEHNGNLYLGSFRNTYIGMIKL